MENKNIPMLKKKFINTFNELLSGRFSPTTIWADFITMFACSLSNIMDIWHWEEREKLYWQTAEKYSQEERDLFLKLAAVTMTAFTCNPEQDFLGDIYMSLGLGKKGTGQFFTPYHICDVMEKITMDDVVRQVKEKGVYTIADYCCGAGATLIAGVNHARKELEKAGLDYRDCVLAVAEDIDTTVALMCYIQLSLIGVPGFVKVSNSLTDPITGEDFTRLNSWLTPALLTLRGTDRKKKYKKYN